MGDAQTPQRARGKRQQGWLCSCPCQPCALPAPAPHARALLRLGHPQDIECYGLFIKILIGAIAESSVLQMLDREVASEQ